MPDPRVSAANFLRARFLPDGVIGGQVLTVPDVFVEAIGAINRALSSEGSIRGR